MYAISMRAEVIFFLRQNGDIVARREATKQCGWGSSRALRHRQSNTTFGSNVGQRYPPPRPLCAYVQMHCNERSDNNAEAEPRAALRMLVFGRQCNYLPSIRNQLQSWIAYRDVKSCDGCQMHSASSTILQLSQSSKTYIQLQCVSVVPRDLATPTTVDPDDADQF